MEVTMLLCDAAESVNGKLYILGGGWSQLIVPDVPVGMALAVKIEVPWDQANIPHTVTATLLDHDGNTVEIEGQDGQIPIRHEVKFETGRPPGLVPGTSLDAPIVFNFQGLALPADGYVWELQVDGQTKAHASFRVGQPNRR